MPQELQPKPLQTLSPDSNSAPTPEVEVEEEELETTPVEEEGVVEGEEDVDIDSLLGDDPEEKKEPITADPESPQFKDLAKQFQEIMGVDLSTALEQYNQLAAQMSEMQSKVQEREAQDSLKNLQDAWDVTPTELDRRVAKVMQVVNKMTPAQKERYDSLDGIQKLWAKIETASAKSAPASGGEKKGKGSTKEPSYKTSELRKMMRENPGLYDKSQALIQAAFAAGRVTDD